MNFTVKEIYTAILPGFVILLHISFACGIWNCFDGAIFHDKLWIPFLLLNLTIGCMNNIISSVIDHKGPWHEPKDVEPPENVENWYQVKDALDKNDKIEEYYTRFAQARNMSSAMLLSLFIILYVVLINCQYWNLLLLAFDFIIFCILVKGNLPRQRKRYYEVIKAEYEKLLMK